MKHRRRARLHAVPKHLGVPGQWAQMSWRLLGMLFIAALLLASLERSATDPSDDLGPPAREGDSVAPLVDD